jgi:hypothetical protein
MRRIRISSLDQVYISKEHQVCTYASSLNQHKTEESCLITLKLAVNGIFLDTTIILAA